MLGLIKVLYLSPFLRNGRRGEAVVTGVPDSPFASDSCSKMMISQLTF
jgi:hypothetical protein